MHAGHMLLIKVHVLIFLSWCCSVRAKMESKASFWAMSIWHCLCSVYVLTLAALMDQAGRFGHVLHAAHSLVNKYQSTDSNVSQLQGNASVRDLQVFQSKLQVNRYPLWMARTDWWGHAEGAQLRAHTGFSACDSLLNIKRNFTSGVWVE